MIFTMTEQDSNTQEYRVLARKYRPANFEDMIGQEALVRTLTNAIQSGRIAQAFVLTGVRGVGKTTTARIIAKALNCLGPDGTGNPTASPCGVCDNCVAISEDRHVDVQEMDAASRTGVDDIRELIEGVRYKPVAARYKIYILDEVHMLSKNAFNALLKTLEEPPEHVKFIFATTEIRKVPITVLSRCQRFDLRRIPVEKLAGHFKNISTAEGIEIEDDAVAMVARAADGSARDGLSILDQAIALSSGTVTAQQLRDMLGLADRARIFDLFEAIMQGKAADALDALRNMYDEGADPVVIMQDMLDVCYWLTRLKLTPALAEEPSTPDIERSKGMEMAGQLSQPILSRAWQMLLKGLQEVMGAPNAIQAAEMVVVRLIHVADMPTPGDLVKKLTEGGLPAGQPNGATVAGAGNGGVHAQGQVMQGSPNGGGQPTARLAAVGGQAVNMQVGHAEAIAPVPQQVAKAAPKMTGPKDFNEAIQLFRDRREGMMVMHLENNVHLVKFQQGHIEMRLVGNVPKDIHGKVGQMLSTWTGERWLVTLSNDAGAPTVASQKKQAQQALQDEAELDPLVRAVKKHFPEARIKKVIEAPKIAAPTLSVVESGDDTTGIDE